MLRALWAVDLMGAIAVMIESSIYPNKFLCVVGCIISLTCVLTLGRLRIE
jgi:hypothetical protein